MEDRRQRSPIVEASRYVGHGLTWVASVGLFLALGFWADRRLGTMPLFTIVGAFVGAAAGFYSMYRHLVIEPRERERRREEGGRDG